MWTTSSSSSGPGGADRRRQVAAVRRRHRPENELPVSVAVDAVLAEGEGLVVALTGVRVFSSLLELRLVAMTRARSSGQGSRLSGALLGHSDARDRLLLGVEYADGRVGDNFSRSGAATDPALDAESPVLIPGGGHGGDRSADLSYYLSPLPPPGRFRIIAAWPGRGLPEGITELSADPLVGAAGRIRVLWEPPDPEESPGPPPPPELPPGGWFDRHRG